MKKLRKLFHCKKIVYSERMMPGELVERFNAYGQRWVRIAFTNRVKFKGTVPTTDIQVSQVTGIRKLPSPFKTKLYSLVGKKPRATYYSFTKK